MKNRSILTVASLALGLVYAMPAAAESPSYEAASSGRTKVTAALRCSQKAAKAGTPQFRRPFSGPFPYQFSQEYPEGVDPDDASKPAWLAKYDGRADFKQNRMSRADVKTVWSWLMRERANYANMVKAVKTAIEGLYGPNHPNWPAFEAMVAQKLEPHARLIAKIEAGEADPYSDIMQVLFNQTYERLDLDTDIASGMFGLCFENIAEHDRRAAATARKK